MIKKGDRVKTTIETWGGLQVGTVLFKRGDIVRVLWDGLSFDEKIEVEKLEVI